MLGPALYHLGWEDPSQEWTKPPALGHSRTQGPGLLGQGSDLLRTQKSSDSSLPSLACWPLAKTSVPGVRKDCLFPISPPPDPNFPRVIGLSERGREAWQQCVSIVNREIQLELHCRRSSFPAEQGGCFLSISLTCLSLTPAHTPPCESLRLPHWAPRLFYPLPLPLGVLTGDWGSDVASG